MNNAPMCRKIIDNVISKINSPCMNCENRKMGCHSTCDKYKEFKITIETEKAKIRNAYDTEIKLDDSAMKTVRKIKKRKKR